MKLSSCNLGLLSCMQNVGHNLYANLIVGLLSDMHKSSKISHLGHFALK